MPEQRASLRGNSNWRGDTRLGDVSAHDEHLRRVEAERDELRRRVAAQLDEPFVDHARTGARASRLAEREAHGA